MTLEKLNYLLVEKQFFTQLVSETLIIGTQPTADSDFPQISTFHAFCSIEYKNHAFVVEYGRSNLPEYQVFTSGEEVVRFVDDRFER